MGLYMDAIEYYQRALKSEAAWRCKTMILKELEQTYERFSPIDNALSCYHKALAIHKKLDDKQTNDHHRLAVIYIAIGSIYSNKQDKDQYLNYLYEALNIELNIEQSNKEILLICYNDIRMQILYPVTHPDIGTIHMNIGNVYQIQKRYRDALEHSKRSLDIQIASLPVDHPDIARSLNNIAGIHHSLGHMKMH